MADDRVDVSLKLSIDKKSEKAVKDSLKKTKKEIETSDSFKIKMSKEELAREKALQYEQKVRYALQKKLEKEVADVKKGYDKRQAQRDKESLAQQKLILKAKEQNAVQIQKQEELQRKINSQKIKEQLLDKKKSEDLRVQLALFKEQQFRNIGGLEGGSLSGAVDSGRLSQLKGSISQLTVDTPDLSNKMKILSSEFKNIQSNAKIASDGTKELGNSALSAFKKFSVWIGVSTIFFQVVSGVKSAITTVKALDSAMVELRKVTDETNQAYDKFLENSFELGKSTGKTAEEAIKATSAFARMGFTLQESVGLAEQALVLTNIGDGIETIDESTKALIATMKGFKGQGLEAEKIVDSLNEVSNKYALTTADLAEGIRRTSGTLAGTNTTFDETLGLLTGGIEVLQNTEKVSSGLITISQRMRGISEDSEELVPKLDDVIASLETVSGKKVSIDIETQNGQLRSTYDILKDIAEVYPDLTSKSAQYLGEALAGKRQIPVLKAILTNWESVDGAIESSVNSINSASKEQEIYLESIDGRMQITTAQIQEFWASLVNSQGIKDIVTFFGNFVEFLTLTEKNLGLLNVALGVTIPLLIAFKGAVLLDKINAVGGVLMNLALSIETIGIKATLATVGVTGLQLAMGGISAVIGIVAGAFIFLKKQHEDFIQDTRTAKQELDGYVGSWEDLNEEQKKNAEIQAEITLGKLREEYSKAKDEIDAVNEEVDKLSRALEVQNDSNQSDYVDELAEALEEAKLRQEELNLVIDAYENAQDISNGKLDETIRLQREQRETSIALNEAWKAQNQVVEEATRDFDKIQAKLKEVTADYEFMSEAKRAETREFVRLELVKVQKLANAVAERLDLYKLEAEGLYEAGIRDLPLGSEEYENLIIQVNKLSDQYHELLDPVETVSTSTKKATKELTEQEKAIQRLSSELKILEIQESLATDDIDKQNELRQSQIDKLKELQSWVEQGSLEWYQYQQQIASVSQEISDSLTKSVEDTNKQLEEQNKLLSEQVEAYENEVKQALENQINSLESARDAQLELAEASIASKEEEIKLLQEKNKAQEEEAKKAKIVLDLEKAKFKLKNLEQERNVRVFRAGQGFVFEADPKAIKAQREEIAKINQQLLDHDVDVNKKAEEQKLKNQLDTLKKEKDAIKKSYDKRLKAIKNTMDSISDVTGSELSKQSSLWQRWAETNSKVLESFGNNIDTLISKIIKLNAQQTENVGTIAENKASIGDYTGYKLDKAQQKSLAVINDPNASAEDKKAHKKWLDSTLANTPKLNTGGATMADGYAMLHQNEVVTNPTQTANLLSMAGVQLGSAMQNARNLFSLSNMPKIAPAMSGGNNGTVIENMSIALPNVTDVQGFANEVQNIKRYFNNKSR